MANELVLQATVTIDIDSLTLREISKIESDLDTSITLMFDVTRDRELEDKVSGYFIKNYPELISFGGKRIFYVTSKGPEQYDIWDCFGA